MSWVCIAASTSPHSTWRPGQKARRESMKERVMRLGEFMLTSTNKGPLEIYFITAS